jgi:hypothetical protein
VSFLSVKNTLIRKSNGRGTIGHDASLRSRGALAANLRAILKEEVLR